MITGPISEKECFVPSDAANLWVAPYWRYYTGGNIPASPRLWVLNPGRWRASVTVRWRNYAGVLMSEVSYDLSPGERLDVIPVDIQVWTATHGVMDGYVQIISDRPVIPWGTTCLDDRATVMPLDPTWEPTWAPMVFSRYEEAAEPIPVDTKDPGAIFSSET
jgi:hypothetical protein